MASDKVQNRKIGRVHFPDDFPLIQVGNGSTSQHAQQKKLGPLARRRRSAATDGFVVIFFIIFLTIFA